jgi:hypothetical protein
MNWLTTSVGSIATKYALRASFAIPFVLAAGFAIAGLTAYLIEQFGARDAYWILAAGFAISGGLAILVVRWREAHEEEEAKGLSTSSVAPLVTAATKAAVAAPGESAKSTASDRGGWASALTGWPLYLLAFGLVFLTVQDRPRNPQYRSLRADRRWS